MSKKVLILFLLFLLLIPLCFISIRASCETDCQTYCVDHRGFFGVCTDDAQCLLLNDNPDCYCRCNNYLFHPCYAADFRECTHQTKSCSGSKLITEGLCRENNPISPCSRSATEDCAPSKFCDVNDCSSDSCGVACNQACSQRGVGIPCYSSQLNRPHPFCVGNCLCSCASIGGQSPECYVNTFDNCASHGQICQLIQQGTRAECATQQGPPITQCDDSRIIGQWKTVFKDHQSCNAPYEGCVINLNGNNLYEKYCHNNQLYDISLVTI